MRLAPPLLPCVRHVRQRESEPALCPRTTGIMLHPTRRLTVVALASFALSACVGGESLLPGTATAPRPGLSNDPRLLIATTRLPVGDPIKKPWFSAERSADMVFAEARLTPPEPLHHRRVRRRLDHRVGRRRRPLHRRAILRAGRARPRSRCSTSTAIAKASRPPQHQPSSSPKASAFRARRGCSPGPPPARPSAM